jgi:hypothetical protein
MIRFFLNYDIEQTEPEAILEIPFTSIDQVFLSVANRSARNRTSLYQKKHPLPGNSSGDFKRDFATRQRDPSLAALNWPISQHYQILCKQYDLKQNSRIIAFPISDLTANPLRPHFDYSISPEQYAFQSKNINLTVFRKVADARLFHLEDEPLGKVPYSILFCSEEGNQSRFSINQLMVNIIWGNILY